MTSYDNIKLEKGLYTLGKSFTEALESIDPSENYIGTELEGLDAFERQLKRFDIKVSGKNSDPIEKFFRTTDSAALFPEYISRAVAQGIEENNSLNSIVATTTTIEGLDYRSIAMIDSAENCYPAVINEGAYIPETKFTTQNNLIKLVKRGRTLCASYEAIRFQRLDLFTVALKQIGAAIALAEFEQAVNVLINGDGNDNPISSIISTSGGLTYSDMVKLWLSVYPYKETTIVASPYALMQILNLSEFRDSSAGLSFHGTGNLVTPFGAELMRMESLEPTVMIALDRNYALEKVQAGTVTTEFDKLIDRQLERAAITSTVGFAKIFSEAAMLMNLI